MPSTPCAPTPEIAREISGFLNECEYNEATIKNLGLATTPWRGSAVQPLLSYKIPDNPRLERLIRLFHFGESVPAQRTESILGPEFVDKMIACRMMRRNADLLIPECMLAPYGAFLLAGDSVTRLHEGHTDDLVLGPSSSMRMLARSLIIRQRSDVLDLGTGCGVLALVLAGSSKAVRATDINPRAEAFTRFNAALNGIANIEASCGDRFEPVEDETFDLIVSNPPFFLGPEPHLLFTSNALELDSFVESLARAAGRHLNSGGFFQMTCEWVERSDEPWKQRLTSWFEGSGCDVLVLKAYEVSTIDYTLRRAAEAAAVCPVESGDSLLRQMRYFEQQHVSKIFGGVVSMRRRDGKNWMVFEEMEETPAESFGELLEERFATLDVITSAEGAALLGTRPRVAKGVRLMQPAIPQEGVWKGITAYLERPGALGRRVGFEPEIIELIARFDGSKTVETIVEEVAKGRKLSATKVAEIVLKVVRDLASRGMIEFPSAEL